MIRTVLAVAAIAVGVTTVAAQDPIAARKALMKNNGAQAQAGARMVRGDDPFDANKAKAIFAAYAESADKVMTMFPANSKTGGDTTAAPAIWEKMDDFKAKMAKFGADAKAASAKVTDLASFKAEFPAVQKNCGGCHEVYRIKK